MNRLRIVALAAAILLARSPAGARPIDFLSIAANVDSSSGGHFAIRFDGQVYHFQNDDLGILSLQRDPYDYFRWTYAILQNRTIRVARVEASDDTYERLRDSFNRRYLLEQKHRAVLGDIQRDGALFDALLAEKRGAPTPGIALRAAGFFRTGTASESPALARLRQRVLARYGAGFLDRKKARFEQELVHLQPTDGETSPLFVSSDRYPVSETRFSERYEELALELVALDVLERAAALEPHAVIGDNGAPELELTPRERRRLEGFRARLENDLVTLVGSGRPDWGYPLLVGTARLEAVRQSLDSGRLACLDAFASGADTIEGDEIARREAFLTELLEDARAKLAAARSRAFAEQTMKERSYAELEEAANRFVEIEQGLRLGRPVRVQAGKLVPSLSAPGRGLPVPDLCAAELARQAHAARTDELSYRGALGKAFPYHLVRSNCATEIFAMIDSAFGRDESVERLGGYIDPQAGLTFVPFAALGAVVDNYDVAAVGEIPSYRRARLGAMYARENPALAYLRESSTLTSTIYRSNDADSLFLFFTDETIAPRPLFGLANVAAGIGQSVWGALRSPFDRGRTLKAGVLGAAFSVPELAFMNIRKGTFEYGPTETNEISLALRPVRAD